MDSTPQNDNNKETSITDTTANAPNTETNNTTPTPTTTKQTTTTTNDNENSIDKDNETTTINAVVTPNATPATTPAATTNKKNNENTKAKRALFVDLSDDEKDEQDDVVAVERPQKRARRQLCFDAKGPSCPRCTFVSAKDARTCEMCHAALSPPVIDLIDLSEESDKEEEDNRKPTRMATKKKWSFDPLFSEFSEEEDNESTNDTNKTKSTPPTTPTKKPRKSAPIVTPNRTCNKQICPSCTFCNPTRATRCEMCFAVLRSNRMDDIVREQMNEVHPDRFLLIDVTQTMPIREFEESWGLGFRTGRGYYEFTKPERISLQKEIIFQHKTTGAFYTGRKAQELLGISTYLQKDSPRLQPQTFGDFRVFVQSTSYNRKLMAGTKFLYSH